MPPAGLFYPLPVPTRLGICISIDFIELPVARSGHEFSQVHINLLTGRVWLVPTFKTATAETAAWNFLPSVFRDLGLPDVLVSDRDTRFTSAFWVGQHETLGASLIFGSPHHHCTTSKVERVNGVIADVLRSFVRQIPMRGRGSSSRGSRLHYYYYHCAPRAAASSHRVRRAGAPGPPENATKRCDFYWVGPGLAEGDWQRPAAAAKAPRAR